MTIRVLQVSIRVMEEVYSLFVETDFENSAVMDFPEEQAFLCLSVEAFAGTTGTETLQFQGLSHQIAVSILVDSGSSASFISEHLLAKLPPKP